MALSFTWTAYVDTDLAFSEFFAGNHTLTLRYMPHYHRGYEGPCIAENGAGTFFLGQGSYIKPENIFFPPSPRLFVAVGAHTLHTNVAIKAELWHHLALVATATFTGRQFTLYVNGVPEGTLTVPAGSPDMPSGTLRFGKRTTGMTTNDRNAQFYGLLKDVGVFTRALNVAEIGALASPGVGLKQSHPDLLAGYPLTPGSKSGKFGRPITLHGPAKLVQQSLSSNHGLDAKLLPEPSAHQPMDLPFKLGEAWRTGQWWNSPGSHYGLAAFCWDMTLEGSSGTYPDGTNGAPLYATAPGKVVEVRESAPSGEVDAQGNPSYSNHVDIEQAAGEVAVHIHLQQFGVTVQKNQQVKLGEQVGFAGDSGTAIGNFHLHFAVSDKPDQTAGFVTIPVAFNDYEVQDPEGKWQSVARGVPRSGDIVRNPPTPTFGAKSLDPRCAVSRAPNQLDLLATDDVGRIWRAHWTPGRYANNWDRWRPVLKDIGGPRPVGVVSRSPSRLDIVTLDGAGGVYTGGWNEDFKKGLWGGWWRIADHVGKANGPVAIVSRAPGMLDVFSVRQDGAISTAAWDHAWEDGKWRGWWSVAGGLTVPGGWITALARKPDQLDVFVVGLDGGVYTATWNANVSDGVWQGWQRIKDMVAKPGSYVAAVARHPDLMDIFVVRTDGEISSAAKAKGVWKGWWSIAGGLTHQGTPVTVVSRHPDKLDLFVVGLNGGVYTSAWDQNAADAKWLKWRRILDLTAIKGSAVAAVARDPNKLDIFAVRTDGQMSTAAWDTEFANGEWRGWWRIGV